MRRISSLLLVYGCISCLCVCRICIHKQKQTNKHRPQPTPQHTHKYRHIYIYTFPQIIAGLSSDNALFPTITIRGFTTSHLTSLSNQYKPTRAHISGDSDKPDRPEAISTPAKKIKTRIMK